MLVEVCEIEWSIRCDVGGNLRAFRDGYVFPVHEKKERGRRKEKNSRGYHCTGHRSGMAAAAAPFYRAQRHLLSVDKLNVINVDVQLSRAAHSPLRMCFRDLADRHCSVLNY